MLELFLDDLLEMLSQHRFQYGVPSLVVNMVRQVLDTNREVCHLDAFQIECFYKVFLGIQEDLREYDQANNCEDVEEHDQYT